MDPVFEHTTFSAAEGLIDEEKVMFYFAIPVLFPGFSYYIPCIA